MNRQRILHTASLVAATLLMAACTQDEFADAGGTDLPEGGGKYPMTFATAVEGLPTRTATADGRWTESDRIAVGVRNAVKSYRPTNISGASATLTCTNDTDPFYWQASTETVSAWYLGTGYNATLPATWTVQSDQNANDGYQQSDFLYAPATTISFADRGSAPLKFYHQTAKVVINILNKEAATDAGQIQRVVIGNNDLALSGSYAAPGAGQTAGTWSDHADTGAVTPKEIAAAAGCLKSYTALVIPQNMTNKQFIKITVDGYTYCYTPKNNDGNLLSGKQHTYNITVKNGYLEVTTATGGEWGDAGSEVVGSKTVAEGFSAADLKPGDYYYSDNTTSDGGYRKYTDGSTGLLGVMPVPGKTCIGIVYCTDNSFITNNSTKKTNYPHGLVVALKEAGSTYKWANRDNAVNAYKGMVSAPAGSSDWYVPNKEELQYICRGSDYDSPSVIGRNMLHTQFSKLGSTYATNFVSTMSAASAYYWSSTESSSNSNEAFHVIFSMGIVFSYNKTHYFRVRCVLAF